MEELIGKIISLCEPEHRPQGEVVGHSAIVLLASMQMKDFCTGAECTPIEAGMIELWREVGRPVLRSFQSTSCNGDAAASLVKVIGCTWDEAKDLIRM